MDIQVGTLLTFTLHWYRTGTTEQTIPTKCLGGNWIITNLYIQWMVSFIVQQKHTRPGGFYSIF